MSFQLKLFSKLICKIWEPVTTPWNHLCLFFIVHFSSTPWVARGWANAGQSHSIEWLRKCQLGKSVLKCGQSPPKIYKTLTFQRMPPYQVKSTYLLKKYVGSIALPFLSLLSCHQCCVKSHDEASIFTKSYAKDALRAMQSNSKLCQTLQGPFHNNLSAWRYLLWCGWLGDQEVKRPLD